MMIQEFIRYLHLRNLSPNTIINYNLDLCQFNQYCAGIGKDITTAIKADIQAWLSNMDCLARSKARKLTSLRMFYCFLGRKGKIEHNPADFKGPSYTAKLPDFLNEEEMQQLLEKTATWSDPDRLRARAILYLFYSSGLRIAELAGIRKKDIDWFSETIRITGKGRKERIVPVHWKALSALKYWLDILPERDCDPESKIFKIGISYIRRIMKKEFGINPHMIRHSSATHLLNAGADISAVSEYLGHKSISSTMVYTHISKTRLKAVYDKAHPHAKK